MTTIEGAAPTVHYGDLLTYQMVPRDRPKVELLPDPEPRPVRHTVISVDDHLIEPPHMFEGRVPKRFADRAPRIIEIDGRREVWLYEDKLYQETGLGAVKGRRPEEWHMEPVRFDEMRRGCWDIKERIRDMDLNGVWASLCFPSLMAGFAGRVFTKSADQELGLACLRAWNDWHLEEWAGYRPDRIIPLQITWLSDPTIAAGDIRTNAERGFKAVSFPERPDVLGLPNIGDAYWDPFLTACEETDTVVCLHAGSSTWKAVDRSDVKLGLSTTMFPVSALVAAIDWLWTGVFDRHPGLKVAMSEGGIGWVPMLLDRLDYVMDHSGRGSGWAGSISPTETVLRNFWFCTIDDPSTIKLRDRIGVERIMLEVDYPHADSTWPDTQAVVANSFADLDPHEVDLITHLNAAQLFRHPLPPAP